MAIQLCEDLNKAFFSIGTARIAKGEVFYYDFDKAKVILGLTGFKEYMIFECADEKNALDVVKKIDDILKDFFGKSRYEKAKNEILI